MRFRYFLPVLLVLSCSHAASEPVITDAKVGDIVPIVGVPYLTFAAPEPMKNRRGETYAFGDRCRVFDHGSLEVVVTDGAKVLLVYREPRERPTVLVSGVDANAEAERLDCPDLSPIICTPDEWHDLVRTYRLSGGDRATEREWVRTHLKPSH